MKIPSVDEMRDSIAELLATTRYFPEPDVPKDEYGMPILEPEPRARARRPGRRVVSRAEQPTPSASLFAPSSEGLPLPEYTKGRPFRTIGIQWRLAQQWSTEGRAALRPPQLTDKAGMDGTLPNRRRRPATPCLERVPRRSRGRDAGRRPGPRTGRTCGHDLVLNRQ